MVNGKKVECDGLKESDADGVKITKSFLDHLEAWIDAKAEQRETNRGDNAAANTAQKREALLCAMLGEI